MSEINKGYNYDNEYYDRGIGGFHEKSRKIIHAEFSALTAGRTLNGIVDFGCGNGFHAPFLKSKTESLTGLDYSEAILTSPNLPFYTNFYQRDLGQPISLPPVAADAVFSIEVIEHVKDYRQFFKNANGIMPAKGLLFLTTTTYWQYLFIFLVVYRRDVSFKALKEFFAGLWGNEEMRTRFTVRLWDYCTGHYHGFSKKMLKAAAEANGFSVKKISYLFIEDLVPVNYLKQPYNGKFKILVRPFIWTLYVAGTALNWVCRTCRIYGSNVLLVAEKN